MNRIGSKIVLLSSLVVMNQAYSDTDVVTTISVGMINIDTHIQDRLLINDTAITNGTVTNDRRSKIDTSGSELAITVIDDDLYFGFTTLFTGQSASDYSNHYVQNHPTMGVDELIANPESVSLTSYSAYLGRSIFDNMRIYGGMTLGKSNTGEEMFFEESGPFVGMQYIQSSSPRSSLTFDLSYSALTTKLNLKENGENYFSAGNQDGYTIDADTTGFSISVTWLKALDRGRSFFVKLKHVDFSIDNGSVAVTGPLNATGIASVSGSKSVTTINLGMGF